MTSPHTDTYTCGRITDPWGIEDDTCNRPPHPDSEPCSEDPHFDAQKWRQQTEEEAATQHALIVQLTEQDRSDIDRQAFEEGHDDGRTAADDDEDARSWKWDD